LIGGQAEGAEKRVEGFFGPGNTRQRGGGSAVFKGGWPAAGGLSIRPKTGLSEGFTNGGKKERPRQKPRDGSFPPGRSPLIAHNEMSSLPVLWDFSFIIPHLLY
jgi:hypothetical protein